MSTPLALLLTGVAAELFVVPQAAWTSSLEGRFSSFCLVYVPTLSIAPLAELKVDEWDRMIDVNIKGVMNGVAAVLPTFLAQKSGHIIATSSVAGPGMVSARRLCIFSAFGFPASSS